MDLFVSDNKLRGAIESEAASRRLYGADMARKLQLRLAALRAAVSLADFWPPKSGPERCHELKGEHAGIFSVDLKQPYRLLFKPNAETPPTDRSDEHQRWKSITAIEILKIEDTHE
jgi:proteic killer suppression protein